MRAPPPVSIDLGLCVPERAAHAGLHGLAAAALGAWLVGWLHDAGDAMAALAGAAAAGGLGLWIGWRGFRPVTARLNWDGRGWSLGGEPGRLQLLLDAGSWLGLRFHPQDGARSRRRGFVVTRSSAGTRWHALRAAVYCPATEDTAAANTAPPDRPA